MRRLTFPIVILAVAVWISCHSQQPSQSAATRAPAASSPWKMELTSEPAQLRANAPAKLRLKLTSPDNRPVEGAEVTAFLTMPLMDMGKNEVRFAGIGNGVYEGTAKFTMVGPWNVAVAVKTADKTGQQTIPIAVRE